MNRTAFIVLMLGACLGAAYAGPPQPLVRVKTISLGGLDGRIDHMCVDTQNERLYAAALTNDSLEVIDLKQGKRVLSVPGLGGPQGVMIVPESHEIAVASGEDGVFRLYDEKLTLVRFLKRTEERRQPAV
jgi:hypothetical protein